MARLLGNDGLTMNQANGNAHMRVYSRGKNDVGPYIRFSISGGNPNLHIVVKTFFAFTQTNGFADFNSSVTRWNSIFCDTGGNTYGGFSAFYLSGANIDLGWNIVSRQADLWVMSSSNGGFPGKASICCEIYCDRWDYLNISNL